MTQLSLLFGSTWVVNPSVFGGVLAMVLAANGVAGRLRGYERKLWYSLLALAIYLGSLQVAIRRRAQAQSTP